jgi:citrate lyase beta subunit
MRACKHGRMRHFDFLDDTERERLFHRAPEAFGPDAELDVLAMALGATLYCPANRPNLAVDIARRSAQGVTSMVLCLEDSIADAEVGSAEGNLVAQLREHARVRSDGPLLFVRVRAPEQIPMIVERLGTAVDAIAGFVLPKFNDDIGAAYLDEIETASSALHRNVLVMPVIESREAIYTESRTSTLTAIRRLLDKHRDHVLAVRIGATDMSAAYGLRRSRDHTVYDIGLIRDVISDVVNIFGRHEGGYPITGPVWEYFSGSERMFKPLLRETPFIKHDERKLRAELIAKDMDGLIREVTLDRANGLTGKSVIHPTHVPAVHALSVVSHEEYLDATDVLGTAAGGGVAASAYGNKMNESKPHTAWARRTQLRAQVFGVAREGVSYIDLLGAGLHQE